MLAGGDEDLGAGELVRAVALRFGLGGKPRLSLSQVGKALAVSKERVRQIQDRALEKLRAVATELGLEDILVTA